MFFLANFCSAEEIIESPEKGLSIYSDDRVELGPYSFSKYQLDRLEKIANNAQLPIKSGNEFSEFNEESNEDRLIEFLSNLKKIETDNPDGLDSGKQLLDMLIKTPDETYEIKFIGGYLGFARSTRSYFNRAVREDFNRRIRNETNVFRRGDLRNQSDALTNSSRGTIPPRKNPPFPSYWNDHPNSDKEPRRIIVGEVLQIARAGGVTFNNDLSLKFDGNEFFRIILIYVPVGDELENKLDSFTGTVQDIYRDDETVFANDWMKVSGNFKIGTGLSMKNPFLIRSIGLTINIITTYNHKPFIGISIGPQWMTPNLEDPGEFSFYVEAQLLSY